MRLNPNHRARVEGKSILVVDDFITRGYSTECARNLLLLAGASAVNSVALGKYSNWQNVITPAKGYTWDPYAAVTHPNNSFMHIRHTGTTDATGLGWVRESYERVAKVKS